MAGQRTSFTLEELDLARQILELQAPMPPLCVCGKRDYRFSIWKNGGTGTIIYLKAQCRDNACRFQRYYNSSSGKWGPLI